MLIILEKSLRWVFVLALLGCIALYWQKDKLPDASFYDLTQLDDPRQFVTDKDRFRTRANNQEYLITPLYDYELEAVVVSYHNSDDFTDITHHERWQDFINLRDLCVIWGSNIETGVYREMGFKNGTWTCWYSWPNSEVRQRFDETRLSNNHLLIDNDEVKRNLMQAEPGDHIRLKGMLVEYSNPANGFHRGTSVTRTDTGNGACETIYVSDFEIVKKANVVLRNWYELFFWTMIVSLFAVVVLFFISPYRGRFAA